MSYDLAVWEGERPADDKTAARAFRDLYDRYMGDTEANVPPTERIQVYVAALLERWCDLTCAFHLGSGPDHDRKSESAF